MLATPARVAVPILRHLRSVARSSPQLCGISRCAWIRAETGASMSNDMQVDPERVYAIGAAARLLGVSPSTLRDCERRGEITSTQTRGGHRRFRGAELLRLREVSGHHVAARKPRPMTSNDTTTSEETKARHTWLGQRIGRAQRQPDPAPPAEGRL